MAIVNTNFNSTLGYQAVANIRKNETKISAAISKLSSGLRIVTASEDPSGISLSNKYESQMRGIRQAIGNTEDVLNMMRVGGDALMEASSMLVRLRDLSLRAMSTATVTAADQAALQNEFNGIRTEIMRQAKSVSFNGKVLLSVVMTNNGVAQIGPDNGARNRLSYNFGMLTRIQFMNVLTNLLRVKLTSGHAPSALRAVSNAIKQYDTIACAVGVMERKVNSIINDLMSTEIQMAGAKSRIKDADMAQEISTLAKLQIVNQAGIAVVAQSNDMAKKAAALLENIVSGAKPIGAKDAADK